MSRLPHDTFVKSLESHSKIRLAQDLIDIICDTFKATFMPGDELWIFGSRVNQNAKGGDIDLFIKTKSPFVDQAFDAKLNFLTQLFLNIEEQKIDVVVQYGNHKLPIYEIAQEEGIRLV